MNLAPKNYFSGSNIDDVLAALNAPQRKAVLTTQGPLLVLAGAGTGKTRVLISRLTYLLSNNLAKPYNVLAVTFTNKASNEMRQRVTALIGPSAESLWLGTFHSLSTRLLRRHAELVGLNTNFTILDMDDQLRLIKQILQAEQIDDKKMPPRMVASVIGRWKDRGLVPEHAPHDSSVIKSIYFLYQERLRNLNAVDFGDLLLYVLALFQKHPDILQNYQQQFQYILVDEYQDTNVAQYLWLRLLCDKPDPNICCVGDDDQSIYGWRGAEVENILRFEKDFPSAEIIRLEQNYRSNEHILAAASHLIGYNSQRLGKTLWTAQDGGEKVRIKALWDSEQEARFIGDEIESLQYKGHLLADIAILVRAGFQTREFEERFIQLAIPYRVIGGPRFYERQEIRDAIAYLRLVIYPHDNLAFERVINTPRRGIGPATVQMLYQYARDQEGGGSLFTAAEKALEEDQVKGAAKRGMNEFVRSINRWRQEKDKHLPSEIVKIVLEESGYTAMLTQEKTAEAMGRLENLKELGIALEEFSTLEGFLEHVSLVMDNATNPSQDMVTIMTLHSAKGLEFDTVFLSGWEEGVLPNARALEESGQMGLEEERRLAYVGLTRAKQRAIVTFAGNRRIYNNWQMSLPSRFLKELPEDHIDVESLSSARAQPTFDRPHHREIEQSALMPRLEKQGVRTIGQRVFHEKFGYGIVKKLNGNALIIDFDHSGEKTVISTYVRLS